MIPTRCIFFVAISWIFVALGAVTSAQVPQPTSNPMNEPAEAIERAKVLPEVSVDLLGPIAALKGHDWPRGYDWVNNKPNQPERQIIVNEPREISVRLPSGRTVRYVSKATFFIQERGVVTRVSLMPQLGPPLRYQDAINLLELVLKQWDAEPDDSTKKSLAGWKAEGDVAPNILDTRSGSAALRGEDKVGIYFEMRSTFSNSGWVPTIDVAAHWEEVRQILGLPSIEKPSSQPSTMPADGAH